MRTNLFNFLLLFLMSNLLGFAQFFHGYQTDNYSGIHGVLLNPAQIADSRVRLDVNLLSSNGFIANDYVGLSLENVQQLITDTSFSGISTMATNNNNVAANISFLGPSFMFGLSERHSIGLISAIRTFNTYNSINGEFIEGLTDGFGVEDFNFDMSDLDATSHLWGEVGLSYGRVIFDNYDQHFLKAGITAKVLFGGFAAQGTSNALSGTYDGMSNTITVNGTFDYLSSLDGDFSVTDILGNTNLGFGADLGLVYEYRDRATTPSSLGNPREQNKYRVKVGVALLDFGSITYKNQVSNRYTLSGTVNAEDFETDFEQALEDNFQEVQVNGEVTIALPTSLNLNVDYMIVPSVYANVNVNRGLVDASAIFNNNRLNQITLTPRFETRFFSAYLPIAHSKLTGTVLGVGVKVGPVILGSSTILSNIMGDTAQGFNTFFATKIQIKHRR